MADGRLTFSTAIDTSGMKKDAAQVEQTAKQIAENTTMVDAEATVNELNKITDAAQKTGQNISQAVQEATNVNVSNAPGASVSDINRAGESATATAKKTADGVQQSAAKATEGVRTTLGGVGEAAADAAEKTEKEFKESFNGVKQNASALEGQLKTLMTGVISGYTGKKLLDYFVGSNADMEQYEVSFATMLGNAGKAKTLLSDLSQFAAVTPFGLADLAESSKLLLSFGENVENLQGDLKMLGDISQGNAEKFGSLSLVFAQVQSQGKLMGQDLLQMINAGFNPLNVIAQQTGESMASLKDKMAQGEISFAMVADAMRAATSEGGQFFNAMENQSKTMNGMLSTLQDNFVAFGRDAGKQAFIALEDALQGVLDKINELQQSGQLAEYAEEIGNNLAKVVETIIALAGKLWEYREAVVKIVEIMAIFKISMSIGSILKTLIASFMTLTGTLTQAAAAQWGLNVAMDANPIGAVLAVVGVLILALTSLIGSIETAEEQAKNAVQKYNDTETELKTTTDKINANLEKRNELLESGNVNPQVLADLEAENEFLEQKKKLLEENTIVEKADADIKTASRVAAKMTVVEEFMQQYRTAESEYKKAVAEKRTTDATYYKNSADELIKNASSAMAEVYKIQEEGLYGVTEEGKKAAGFITAYAAEINAANGIIDTPKAYTTAAASAAEAAKATFKTVTKGWEEVAKSNKQAMDVGLMTEAEYYTRLKKLLEDNNVAKLGEYGSYWAQYHSYEKQQQSQSLSDAKRYETEHENLIKKEATAFTQGIKEQTTAAENLYKTLENERSSYEDKLSSSPLFRTEKLNDDDEVMVLTNYKDKISELNTYRELLSQIQQQGASSEFVSEVAAMGVTEAVDYMQTLLKSDSLDSYLRDWEAYNRTASEIATDMYAEQMDAVKIGFVDGVSDEFGLLAGAGSEAGTATAEAFAAAILNSRTDVFDAVSQLIDDGTINDIVARTNAIIAADKSSMAQAMAGGVVANVVMSAATAETPTQPIVVEAHTTLELEGDKLGESVTVYQTDAANRRGN
jgi:tape measure domain-containing protein